jgi:hypothetical protein
LADINPEAMIRFSDRRTQLMLLSDDGTLAIEGVDCKTLGDPSKKRFRSRWIALPGREK